MNNMEATKTNAVETFPKNEQQSGTATTPRKDVYAIVTERIIEQVQKGTAPWRQPWTDAGIPRNVISQRPYRGINIILLAMLGYEDNQFVTFKQVKELGGTVKKGERSHLVVYWNYVEQNAKETDMPPVEGQPAKKVPMLRYYTVFNVGQCEGIPDKYLAKIENKWQPLETCNQIIDDMPHKPKIVSKEHRAFYDPLKDSVNMPKASSFERPKHTIQLSSTNSFTVRAIIRGLIERTCCKCQSSVLNHIRMKNSLLRLEHATCNLLQVLPVSLINQRHISKVG